MVVVVALAAGLLSVVAPHAPSSSSWGDPRFDRVHRAIEAMRHADVGWRERDDVANARAAQALHARLVRILHDADRLSSSRVPREWLCGMTLRADAFSAFDDQLERAPPPAALADDPAKVDAYRRFLGEGDTFTSLEAVPWLRDVVRRAGELAIDDACVRHARGRLAALTSPL